MTLIFKRNPGQIKMNKRGHYLIQKSFDSEVIVWTRTRLISLPIGVASYGALGHVSPRLITIYFFQCTLNYRIQNLTATICRQSPRVNIQ